MKIKIQLDDSCKELQVIIITDQMSEQINHIIQRLSEDSPQVLTGFQDDILKILEPSEILRIYTTAGKVYAITETGEYTLRLRLYELEERLNKNHFVRISNSEIINLKKVKHFDLSFTGTICITLTDGTVTYTSRRYVTKIKQVLGI